MLELKIGSLGANDDGFQCLKGHKSPYAPIFRRHIREKLTAQQKRRNELAEQDMRTQVFSRKDVDSNIIPRPRETYSFEPNVANHRRIPRLSDHGYEICNLLIRQGKVLPEVQKTIRDKYEITAG